MFLVMFVMFIASLLGLLISLYVQNMISISRVFYRYYHTYYLAYAWLELWLTQSKYHGYGFQEDTVLTDNTCINSWCTIDMQVVSRGRVIANTYDERQSCDALEASGDSAQEFYTLSSGDCIIQPLFFDTATWFSSISYDNILDSELLFINPTLYNDYTWGVWSWEDYSIRVIDEELSNLSTVIESVVGSPSPYTFAEDLWLYSSGSTTKNYLIIANPSNTTKQFCIEVLWTWELVMKYINIISIGTDWKNTIALSAIKSNEIPSYLCYGAINP